jgi:hypothetical protein
MERKTYRLPSDMLREISAEARRRGVAEVQYVREAIARQLGRDTCRDEIAELRRRLERVETILRRTGR